MAKYKEIWPNPLTQEVIGYFDNENNNSIPLESANPFYQEFLEWQGLGNIPDPAYTQAEIDAYQAEVDRIQDINDAQEGEGMQGITVDEAKAFVDSKLDPVTTLTELTEACRLLFKKIVVYLLR